MAFSPRPLRCLQPIWSGNEPQSPAVLVWHRRLANLSFVEWEAQRSPCIRILWVGQRTQGAVRAEPCSLFPVGYVRGRRSLHPTDEDLSVGTPAFTSGRLASLLAAAVDLLEKVGHHANQRGCETEKKQEHGYCAPQRSVGRQAGLKARWHQRHTRRDQREEAQRCGEYVKVAGHKLGNEAANDLLRFYAASGALSEKFRAVDQLNSGLGEFSFDLRD